MRQQSLYQDRSTPTRPAWLDAVRVRPALPSEHERWDETMDQYHYLGFRSLTGQSMKYVAEIDGVWAALIGWGSAALKCTARDEWIGWSEHQQWQRLRYLVNNQRFLILEARRCKNLASKVLASTVRRLSDDWKRAYGHPVVLAETFIDPERFRGTCYQAAGWSKLGLTSGYGRRGDTYYYHGERKSVWVRPIHRKARQWLTAAFDVPPLQDNGREPIVDLNDLEPEHIDGLFRRLNQLTDPRKARGKRHSQESILAVAVCAVLAGARSLIAIGEWASDLSQQLRKRLRCWCHPNTGEYIVPSEPTIRRMLQSVDVEELDRELGDWLATYADADAVAVDGKTLRGSGNDRDPPVHLLSAILHKEGVVVAQKQVDSKSNEITAFRPLLDDVDLGGKVVTADAMHAQVDHADYLKMQKGADYVFTVKGNQPSTYEAISELPESAFSPSGDNDRAGTRSD